MILMMKHSVQRLMREPASIFFVLIFPSLLTFVLGNMLANMDNADHAINEIKLGYIAIGENGNYAAAQNLFVDSLEENEKISLIKFDGSASAEYATYNDEIDAALYLSLPDGITVYEGSDAIKNRAVNLIAQSFMREYVAAVTIINNGGAATAMREHGYSLIESATSNVSRSMLDYYAVAMIVMIAFIGGAISGAVTLYQNRTEGTLRRILCAPKSRTRIFIDYVMGALPQSVMQTAVAMIVASTCFGINFAQTVAQNMLIFAALTLVGFTLTTTFMIIGLYVRTNPNMPLMAIMWVMLFLSGSFNKEIAIEGVSEYLPPRIIQDAVFDMTMFGREENLLTVMSVCAVIAVCAAIVGAAMLNQKKVTE